MSRRSRRARHGVKDRSLIVDLLLLPFELINVLWGMLKLVLRIPALLLRIFD